MRFRYLVENSSAEGSYFIVLLGIIVFVVCASTLSLYMFPEQNVAGFDGADATTLAYLMSSNYSDGNRSSRVDWLNEHHGGQPSTSFNYDIWGGPSDLVLITWPDGFSMRGSDYIDYANGETQVENSVSIWDIFGGAVTLDIAILNMLGLFGVAIKIIIGISIVVIIYLLLPFTG